MKVIVLGSGVIGVTTAYFLARNGHSVTVIDRQPESAMETSYANGGQLSYSHAEPWATPTVLPKIFKWMLKSDAPLVFNPFRIDPDMWKWGLKFLANCTQKRAEINTENTLRLALYSQKMLHEILREADIDFSYKKLGILHVFQDQKMIDAQIIQAELQKKLGCPYEVLSTDECYKKEPVLLNSEEKIAGGLFFPIDESGDIHVFTKKLAEFINKKYGVVFKHKMNVLKLVDDGDQIGGVKTEIGTEKADRYVMSLGSYSPLFLKKVGINAPIYPMKGYSISIPVNGQVAGAPNISVTDQAKKLVYSRLDNVLRVAGTAEFAGYNTDVKEKRIDSIARAAHKMFPAAGDYTKITKWACLRPQTPEGTPLLGNTKYSNLFLNTGHGTLGWTLSAGSAKAVSDIILGKKLEIDLKGLTL